MTIDAPAIVTGIANENATATVVMAMASLVAALEPPQIVDTVTEIAIATVPVMAGTMTCTAGEIVR